MTGKRRAPAGTRAMRGGAGTRAMRAVAWAAALLALGAVFVSYLDPHLAVDLANRVWSCFGA